MSKTQAKLITLALSALLPAKVELLPGHEIAQADIVSRAAADAELSPESWNGLTEKDRDEAVAAARDAMAAELQASIDADARKAQEEAQHKANAKNKIKLNGNGARSCSYRGIVYEADKNGFVEVPSEAAEHLAGHGFTRA